MEQTYYFPVMWLVLAALITGLIAVNSSVAFVRQKTLDYPGASTLLDNQLRGLGLARQVLWFFVLALAGGGLLLMFQHQKAQKLSEQQMRAALMPTFEPDNIWQAPNPALATTDSKADLIAYGRDLIAHTQDYFGEAGLIKPNAINQLNCQSCHLDAGTKPFGNNYAAVSSTYPQMRARSGALETIPKRINDCFMRSLNGQPLDTNGREMRAMVAYMEWLGTSVPKGIKPKGSGLAEPAFLERPADPAQGKLVFETKCASCHGQDGQGLPMPPEGARKYPPLWGPGSYNEGAGLFRLSRLAGYVKSNMPLGATHDSPQLTDAEAWDVAAFINAQPRPKHPFLDTDWPDISKKPFDHPFGPFRDSFPESQHKFGPFPPIIAFYKK